MVKCRKALGSMSIVVLCGTGHHSSCVIAVRLLSDSGWSIARVLLLWMILLKRWPLASALIIWKYLGNPSHGLGASQE